VPIFLISRASSSVALYIVIIFFLFARNISKTIEPIFSTSPRRWKMGSDRIGKLLFSDLFGS